MSLTVFVVSASIWAFLGVLAAVVATAALPAQAIYWKPAIVGAVVGFLYGLASVGLVFYLGVVGRLVALLALAQLGRIAPIAVSVLLAILAGAIAGAAAGSFATRDSTGTRRCAMVGAAFGLVLGVVNAAVPLLVGNVAIPAIEAVGLQRPRAVVYGATIMAIGIVVDLTLAFIAFRLVGRRWRGAPPATTTGTC